MWAVYVVVGASGPAERLLHFPRELQKATVLGLAHALLRRKAWSRESGVLSFLRLIISLA